MHPLPRRTLRRLIVQYGPALLKDLARVDALLADLCGPHPLPAHPRAAGACPGEVASSSAGRRHPLAATVPTPAAGPRLLGPGRTVGSRKLGLCLDSDSAGACPVLPALAYTANHLASSDAPAVHCFLNGHESAKSCTICESCRAWLAAALLVATVVSGALLAGTSAQTGPRLESLCQSDRERDRTGNPRSRPDRSCIGNCNGWKPPAHCRAGFRLDQFHCSTALAYQRA